MSSTVWIAPERRVYSVSELNREARALLESTFSLLWLEGEISNLSRPASGHLYFSLKDADAQVRCALFRNRSRLLDITINNGQQVLVRARVGLYEPRGDYQLIIEHIEDAGEGALRRAFEALRQRLDREGLFAAESKRALPTLPQRVGVISSPSGAALRDVLSVLKRRFPSLPVLLYPVPVQGEGAGAKIAKAIELACTRQDCDVLLLVRGGGSLEDLWAFNEEVVARAISASDIPIVSGVGHETDVTIADFVADVRAPTPSAAAELISPDRTEWINQVSQLRTRLHGAMQRRLNDQRQRLHWLLNNLAQQHPGRRLQDQMQQVDGLELRLRQAFQLTLERRRQRLLEQRNRLSAQSPIGRVEVLRQQVNGLEQRLQNQIQHTLDKQRQRLSAASRTLHSVSPLQTLGRGYAIVRDAETQAVVCRAEQVKPGDKVEALLGTGSILCQVEKTVGGKISE